MARTPFARMLIRAFVSFAVLISLSTSSCCKACPMSEEDFAGYAEYRQNTELIFDEEVSIPVEENEDELPLHNLSSTLSRLKRSVGDSTKYFSLEAFGEHLHLKLMPNKLLLAPGFKVYHRDGAHRSHEKDPKVAMEDCFYIGTLKKRRNSAAALNICGGLSGLIKTENAEIYIQPTLSRRDHEKQSFVPHILKKRSLHQHDLSGKNTFKSEKKQQTYFCGRKRRYMPHRPYRKHFWLPNEFAKKIQKRQIRSVTFTDTLQRTTKRKRILQAGRQKRNVETLVVADQEMVRKHGTENVTMYILTVFNMVSVLYQDSTIGNNVSVVLVGLVLLEGDEPGLSVSHNAERSLNSFCQWQSTIHTSKGTQHDHAVLLTGLDICSWKDEPCDTLGFAPISGMCSKYRSCTLNEDSGLALAFTVAHEVGHNFGMIHDGQGSACKQNRGTIMSPSLSGLDTSFLWSTCSRHELDKFLESPRALCLSNEPDSPDELQFPDSLPGQLYNADMQCKLQFGSKSKMCEQYSKENEVCKALWCERNGRECETKFLPAAEGTPCGEKKWCRRGVCVNQNTEGPSPIDGGWGPYLQWSNCSRSCNGGIMHRERFCNSPSPRNGGRYCQGDNNEYQVCGMKACDEGDLNFHYDQCATFNKRSIKGKRYQWKPYERDLNALSRCRVYCIPDKEDLYLILSTKLEDGTSCIGNYSSICVNGECRSVGCDGKVDSSSIPDRCGICNGDNSTCHKISGNYEARNLSTGYHEIIKIPNGVRHIQVIEAKESPTFLALKNASGHYILNGQWIIDWPGRYSAAGTTFSYRRWPGVSESLTSKGPTSQDIIVEILVQEGQQSEINYEFVIANTRSKWKQFNSSCSATCGEGVIQSSLMCVDNDDKILEESVCSPSSRPDTKSYICSAKQCPTSWKSGEWSECSSNTCDIGWQYRQIFCLRNSLVVSDNFCNDTKRHPAKRPCQPVNCTYTWIARPWSKCHGECPYGIQRRSVLCLTAGNRTAGECDPSSRLPSVRRCRNDNCPVEQLVTGTWIAGPWSRCNVTCGLGHQKRSVTCNSSRSRESTHVHVMCNKATRPTDTLICQKTDCPSLFRGCEDRYQWCSLAVNKKVCQSSLYIRSCCHSCSQHI